MKERTVLTAALIAILGLSLMVTGAAAEETISYTDPSGDVDNAGFEQSIVDNIDILSLEMDASDDPVTLTMKVAGVFDVEGGSDLMYTYMIYFDQTGDGSENTNIMIGMLDMISSQYDPDPLSSSLDVSGNGTDTLTITFDKAEIAYADHPIEDVFAEAAVSDLETKAAYDEINTDFGGSGSGDDDTSDDDTDDDWDDDWDDDDMMDDPMKETPTDTGITVEIEDADMTLDEGEEMFEVEQTIKGSTSGEVHHCAITMVTYYKDGSYEADDWTVGPEETPRDSFMGMTFENHFYGTGSGGQDDWSSWEFYLYVEAPNSLMEDVMEGVEDLDSDNITSIHVVVRAYSDEAETMWNQDDMDITDIVEGAMNGDDGDDDGLLPAPGLIAASSILILLALAGIVFGYRKRN